MAHDVKVVQKADHCEPSTPPPSVDQEPCHGTITMECCCPRLYTRTFVLNIGPQSEANLINFLQNTVNAYEASGYLVLGHSVADIGAGWMFALSVGWYA